MSCLAKITCCYFLGACHFLCFPPWSVILFFAPPGCQNLKGQNPRTVPLWLSNEANPSLHQICLHSLFTQAENTRSGILAIWARIGGKLDFTSHLFIFTLSLGIAGNQNQPHFYFQKKNITDGGTRSGAGFSEMGEGARKQREAEWAEGKGEQKQIPYEGSLPPTNTMLCSDAATCQHLAERPGLHEGEGKTALASKCHSTTPSPWAGASVGVWQVGG